MKETIQKLDKLFITRYSKSFVELNKNVYKAPLTDGAYEVPVVTVGAGGGTLIRGESIPELNSPAQVELKYKRMKPEQLIYRIAIPLNEMLIAADKPEYFNYLFDKIMSKAIGNYKVTVGDENSVRFGDCYCTYELPQGGVFIQLNDDNFELRLRGSWASDEEAV